MEQQIGYLRSYNQTIYYLFTLELDSVRMYMFIIL